MNNHLLMTRDTFEYITRNKSEDGVLSHGKLMMHFIGVLEPNNRITLLKNRATAEKTCSIFRWKQLIEK